MKTTLAAAIIVAFVLAKTMDACNEAVCGSRVSKCLLTQACQCDLESCHCCKECFSCLGVLFDECCSCVDLCPKRNESEGSNLGTQSSVEDFKDYNKALFDSLTETPEPRDLWSVIRFPVTIDASPFDPKGPQYIYTTSDNSGVPTSKNLVSVNCTVAFISDCLSINKCHMRCRSMGSYGYRWFHDGCCECLGENCINYGINESRCGRCPDGKENDDSSEDYDDEYDFDDETSEMD